MTDGRTFIFGKREGGDLKQQINSEGPKLMINYAKAWILQRSPHVIAKSVGTFSRGVLILIYGALADAGALNNS